MQSDKQSHNSPDKWLVFAMVGVGVFMSTLDGSIVNIALPAIMKDLLSPLSTIEWITMIYLLTISSLLLSFGRLSDIKGRKWVYSRGLAMFSVGSLMCGLSYTAGWLIFSRAIQGFGAAMIMSCTPALMADVFLVSERGKAMGLIGMVVASGLTLGPAIGGWILYYFSWQVIFFINVPIGIITGIIAHRLLKGTLADVSHPAPFDWSGTFFMLFCAAPLLLALTHAYKWGYSSFDVLALILVSLLGMLGLIKTQIRSSHPLMPPSLLKIKLFIFPLISVMLLFIGLFTMIFLMPFFLMQPCGFSMKISGLVMVTPFVFLSVFSPLAGALSDKIGSTMLCTVGMTLLSAGLFLLSQLSPLTSPFPAVWRLAIIGFGISIFTAPNNSLIMSSVPRSSMGVASGTLATARNLGMVIGIAIAGTVFNTIFHKLSGGVHLKSYQPSLESVFMTAFRYSMLTGSIVVAIGIPITLFRGVRKV